MWVTALVASLGAALGAAVAVVWRIGAGAGLCALPPGNITPVCERPGPSAVIVVGCALVGALGAGGVAVWIVRRSLDEQELPFSAPGPSDGRRD